MAYAYLRYIEFFTTIVSLLTLWLGMQQRIATWPINIGITLLNMLLYYQRGLYDRCLIGAISILAAGYGWYQWLYGGENHSPLKIITKTSPQARLRLLIISIVSMALLSQIFIRLRSKNAYWGSFCTVLVILGLWMTAHKKLEAYIIWFLLNVASIYVHHQEKYPWFVCKYVIYLILSVYSYFVWKKRYDRQVVASSQRQ